MLYMVRMTVTLPPGIDADEKARLVAAEKEYSQTLQRAGTIAAIWRVAGQYANYCLFDVADHDALHQAISGLPMFAYLTTHVEALARHPNTIR